MTDKLPPDERFLIAVLLIMTVLATVHLLILAYPYVTGHHVPAPGF
jgi:hypothetical protein